MPLVAGANSNGGIGMNRVFHIGFTALTFFGLTGAAHAANLLTNGSFEQPALAASGANMAYYWPGATVMPGWTVDMKPGAGPSIQLTHNSAFPALIGTDGVQWLDLTGNVGRGGGVLSDAVATAAGVDYELSFDVGAFFAQISFGAATVDLFVNNALAGSYTVLPPARDGVNWQRFTYSFAGTGAPVRVGLYASLDPASSNLGVGLDNVVLDVKPAIGPVAPGVPEPASWAMLIAGFGLAGTALRRRRAQASNAA